MDNPPPCALPRRYRRHLLPACKGRSRCGGSPRRWFPGWAWPFPVAWQADPSTRIQDDAVRWGTRPPAHSFARSPAAAARRFQLPPEPLESCGRRHSRNLERAASLSPHRHPRCGGAAAVRSIRNLLWQAQSGPRIQFSRFGAALVSWLKPAHAPCPRRRLARSCPRWVCRSRALGRSSWLAPAWPSAA